MDFMEYFCDVEDVVGKTLKLFLEAGENHFLFGAGYCVTAVADACEMKEISIEYIIDNSEKKWGSRVHDIEVVSPDYVFDNYKTEGCSILLSTSYVNEITEQMVKRGFKGKIFSLPQGAYYKNALYDKDFLKEMKTRFASALNSLEDKASREVFLNIIRQSISLNNKYYDSISAYEINGYFGSPFFEENSDSVIIDAGAFDGDTYREFCHNTSGKMKAYYAFEPDSANYTVLVDNTKTDLRVKPLCAGLGARKRTMRFASGGNVSSRVDAEGDTIINIESIDNLFIDVPVSFIKMDIEGSEGDALRGGAGTIGKYLPTLAICSYHRRDDLFALIELIKEISNNRYKFFLRHTFYYQSNRMQPDVIIYAVAR